MTLDARRLVRACLLAFVVFLATGGVVVGMAAADAEEGLFVPEPRPGDRATYRIEQVVLDPDVALGDLRLMREASFAWLPEVTATDRSFGQRTAHPLRSSYLFGDKVYNHQTLYDASAGSPLMGATRGTWNDTDGMHYGVVLEDLVGSPGTEAVYQAEWYTGVIGPCGMHPAFTLAPAVGAVVGFAGNCDWPGGEPTTAYRAKGWQDLEEGRGFRFTADKDRLLQVWYDENSPFPLRIEVPLADTVYAPYTYGRLFTLERIAYERGDAPYPPPSAAQGLGPAPTLPRPDWGIPDDGVQHPFPLAQAYGAARAEEDYAGVQQGNDPTVPEFYADNPGTYLAYGAYTDLIDQQGQSHHTWWLLFTDGAQRLGKRVELGPVGFSSVFLPPQAGLATYVYDWEPNAEFAPADVSGIFPAIDQLPTHMPTAQAMTERHANAGLPANAYGFILRCATPTCADVHGEGFAAHSVGDLYGALEVFGGSVVEHSSSSDATWVANDGSLARRYQVLAESQTPFPVVRSAVGEEPAAQEGRQAMVLAAWDGPVGGTAAAGVSFLGLLAGLLYYFWPTAKGAVAGLGLFSRIEDGKVLEHPTRRRVHDAIASEPGIHFQALARKAGVGRGALEHHVRKLVAADLVTVRRAPGYTCYFLKGTIDRHMLDAAPSLRSDGSRAVLQAAAAHPGASSRDLAARLGLSPSTVSYHLKRLETAGLVAPGEKSGVRITPLGAQAAA